MTIEEADSRAPSELCERFANDILYDAHSLRARISRSEAGQKLIDLGTNALPAIIQHYSERNPGNIPGLETEVDTAWCTIFSEIRRSTDPASQPPSDPRVVQEWIAWANERLPVAEKAV